MGELGPLRLSREELEIVIRRAAEIEDRYGAQAPDLSEDDVIRIAGEVGLSETSVRRALAEHRAAAGSETLLVERGWASRLCGPALIAATRRIPESAGEVTRALRDHFRSNEGLRPVRQLKTGSLWEPESGMVASILRSVDVLGRGYQLAKKARAVEMRVIPLSEEECQVTLVADLGNERAGWFWGLGMGGGGSAVAAASVFIVGLPSLPAVAAVGTPVFLAASVGLARSGYGRSVEKMNLVLNGILDRLEHGEALEAPRASWRELFS
ncbi:MAG: hypothetical protein GWN99_10315 [Gemmatimonadetes bacterium]|uniref:Uncharacterized protein n=1 Tax=Candidatus Kutchimonas denitrificans TaxID=3056748 RepID=A0AAE5CBL8_9BACT|nr:hypothetical protein [Gemmatimonadota bacterium]NIR74688.1 hypothetical protein [Candidatus Kutchimonas denitrificans]NIS01438.1 hypothetical protein [Gemmatimonadota bacterium]NIT67179.1 hypothetical protein [Gemmatimonadota bacterium]NIU52353.1 hypothetical protein [Gemmatimonadota bacterium]